MDRDTVIRLAREADLWLNEAALDAAVRFAALVAQAEREECAKVAKAWDTDHPSSNYGGCIANAIRSRT